MGKRTSDFVALAVILSGASVGLGLTSLARIQSSSADDSSVNVEVLRRSIIVGPQFDHERRVVHEALIVEPERFNVRYSIAPSIRFRTRIRQDRSERVQLERLLAEVEGLELEAKAMENLKEALSEALEGVEALKKLDLDEDVTIEIRHDEDDERRRRRRRRPR